MMNIVAEGTQVSYQSIKKSPKKIWNLQGRLFVENKISWNNKEKYKHIFSLYQYLFSVWIYLCFSYFPKIIAKDLKNNYSLLSNYNVPDGSLE